MEDRGSTDLLRLKMDVLWGPDSYGRPTYPHPMIAVGVAQGNRVVRFGANAPLDLPPGDGSAAGGMETIPSEIVAYRDRLALFDPGVARVSGGPSYVVAEESLLDPPTPAGFEIVAAGHTTAASLISARPQEWWTLQEWDDLVAGRLGPCAIGLVAGRVRAICHTPVASSRAAEAGAWTHPDARRQGYGAAVTAAWARMAAPSFETLFYSTAAENAASQGIARSLRLRPIGWIWQLR